jgi:hypothetical protein
MVLSGSPASSTTKTSRPDIDELLLKVALKHQKSNQSIIIKLYCLSVQCMLLMPKAIFFNVVKNLYL